MEKTYKSRFHSLLHTAWFLLLILTLSACTGGTNGNSTATSTPSGSGNNPTPTPTAGVQLGKQNCPVTASDPAHWDSIVPTQPNVSKVESVTCANLVGNNSLQALVLVRSQGSGDTLDVYVYSKITDPAPQKLFQLLGLYKGTAKISGYNTVLTGEVDRESHVNKGQSNSGFTLDLYREFKWSDGVGTLVPVAFPGLFPQLTRFEAENAQAQVNQGQDGWMLDVKQVSTRLTDRLLQWGTNVQTNVVSGGGKSDADAVVEVRHTTPGGGKVKITLSRLEGNTNGGIWVTTAVESDGMAITTPQQFDRLTSPAGVEGKGNAFEGVIGKVVVIDHTYTTIGQALVNNVKPGNGQANFTVSVSYKSTFKGGSQEGILALFSNSNADGSIAGAVLVKEMINA
ncbi:MAG: hypothetical protein J2P37_21745 [Ktedonobacteraceae bacterium]|nr:hypothetical protein [Ktedonobacteraceae bacterium]